MKLLYKRLALLLVLAFITGEQSGAIT